MFRTCAACAKEKPLQEFYHTGRYQTSHRYSCKACDKERARKFRLSKQATRQEKFAARDGVVVKLRKEQKVSYAGIGREVGLSTPTVKNILARVQLMD